MKTSDQLKVIALSFLSIIVMVGVIALVSVQTRKYVESHHGGEHAEGAAHADAGHGAEKHADKMAAADTHKEEAHKEEGHKDEGHKEEGHKAAPKEDKAMPAADIHEGSDHATDADHKEAPKAKAVAVKGDAEAGKAVFLAKTCTACHAIDGVDGAVGAIGPKLNGLGERAATRVPGQDAITYLQASINEPNSYVVDGYAPAMPQLRGTMSDEEYDNLIAYLVSL